MLLMDQTSEEFLQKSAHSWISYKIICFFESCTPNWCFFELVLKFAPNDLLFELEFANFIQKMFTRFQNHG